jgi:hypothetical protein
VHMLELAYWEAEWDRNQRQWRIHLSNARDGIVNIIEDSPSLKNYLAESLDVTYERARRDVETLTGRQLPDKCEWTLAQIRDDTFYPGPALIPRKTRQR